MYLGPMGLATFDSREARDLVCLVGGSGIAGIMSILEPGGLPIDHFQRQNLLTMVFGVRRREDFFLYGRTQSRAAKCPGAYSNSSCGL